MYQYIKGKIEFKGVNYLVLDNHGIGYKIFVPDSVLQKTSAEREEQIYTYLNVREDLMELYGFLSREDLAMFELLLSVSGVGPKVALAVLSALPPSEYALAVVTGNVKAITKVPGVGPKMAQRMILELKDKLKNDQLISEPLLAAEPETDENDAVSALMVLGYSQSEARRAVASLDPAASTEETVRAALKLLIRQ